MDHQPSKSYQKEIIQMKKQIAIRCITKKTKGYGNFTRSLTIGESLRKYGFKIIFLINQNSVIINELQKKKFQFSIIPNSISYKIEPKFISNFLKFNNINSIILDMREYGEFLSNQIKKVGFNVIVIDDAFCKAVNADLLFNGTLPPKNFKYKKLNRNSNFYVGPKYFLAKEEFRRYRKKLSDIKNKKKYNVVISIGGADPTNLTLSVLNAASDLPNIHTTVIMGPFFKFKSKIEKFVRKHSNIKLKSSPSKIWEEFNKADIVISKSGVTLFELALLRVPTICIVGFKHEEPNAKLFEKRKFCINLGFQNSVNEDKIRYTILRLIENKKKRKNMSKSGGKIIDGKGVLRTQNLIAKFIKSRST